MNIHPLKYLPLLRLKFLFETKFDYLWITAIKFFLWDYPRYLHCTLYTITRRKKTRVCKNIVILYTSESYWKNIKQFSNANDSVNPKVNRCHDKSCWLVSFTINDSTNVIRDVYMFDICERVLWPRELVTYAYWVCN